MSIPELEPKDSKIGSDLIGTLVYTSPETLEKNQYSVYSDMYSIGIILYEMLNNFKTSFEKYESIDNLKNKEYDRSFIKTYEYEFTLIKKLLQYS